MEGVYSSMLLGNKVNTQINRELDQLQDFQRFLWLFSKSVSVSEKRLPQFSQSPVKRLYTAQLLHRRVWKTNVWRQQILVSCSRSWNWRMMEYWRFGIVAQASRHHEAPLLSQKSSFLTNITFKGSIRRSYSPVGSKLQTKGAAHHRTVDCWWPQLLLAT